MWSRFDHAGDRVMLMRDDPEDAAAIEGTEVVVRHIHIAVIAQHDPNESALSLR